MNIKPGVMETVLATPSPIEHMSTSAQVNIGHVYSHKFELQSERHHHRGLIRRYVALK